MQSGPMNTTSSRRAAEPGTAGQVIAIMALMLVGLLAMVALVIDGGNAYAQQRATQNGTDAAAEAGAVVLAHRLVGATITDAMVSAAVNDLAADNSVAITRAEYTDVTGQGLGALVGEGVLPDDAAGVAAHGTRTFDTFLGGVIGITELTASTQATAVSGYGKTTCAVSEGCALLPLTPPVYETTCSSSPSLPVTVDPPHEWPEDPAVSIIPLCSTGAGNVGWIDWSFAFDGSPNGGTSATIASTIKPDNPEIQFPTWVQISQTGNTSAGALEAAINAYSGQPVLVPIFSHTCGSDPVPPYEVVSGMVNGVPAGCQANLDDGMGTQMWYYLADIDALLLCGPAIPGCDAAPTWVQAAYLSGSSNPGLYCGTSGGTGCIIGKWVDGFVSPRAIDANVGSGGESLNSGLTVQLIR